MRKIECACGISIDIYSWPPVEIEQNGKKMMERHITCRCTRECVFFTAPKYEPDHVIDEDEKIATVMSFAEMSRKAGVLKEVEPHNKPAADGVSEMAPVLKGTVTFTDDQSRLFHSLVMNYAKWFKQGKASAKEQKKFFAFAERFERGAGLTCATVEISDEEALMCRMALSERNLFHIYGSEMSDADKEVVGALRDHLKEILA